MNALSSARRLRQEGRFTNRHEHTRVVRVDSEAALSMRAVALESDHVKVVAEAL